MDGQWQQFDGRGDGKESPPLDLTVQDDPRPKSAPAASKRINYGGRGSAVVAGAAGLVHTQCPTCKTMLGCDFDRRRKKMVCPICNAFAPLVYVSPRDSQNAKPVNELPIARHPGLWRTYSPWLLSPALFFALGFLACVALYALDGGKAIDRLTRRLVNAVRAEFGWTPAPSNAKAEPTTQKALKAERENEAGNTTPPPNKRKSASEVIREFDERERLAKAERKKNREAFFAKADDKNEAGLIANRIRNVFYTQNGHCARCKAIANRIANEYGSLLPKNGFNLGVIKTGPGLPSAQEQANRMTTDLQYPYYRRFINKYRSEAERLETRYLCGVERGHGVALWRP